MSGLVVHHHPSCCDGQMSALLLLLLLVCVPHDPSLERKATRAGEKFGHQKRNLLQRLVKRQTQHASHGRKVVRRMLGKLPFKGRGVVNLGLGRGEGECEWCVISLKHVRARR